ncbi:hypothetical protein HYX08_02595 [Candidatus Woesearchaeota archaeon]|nr:hypothetical protein [Candidatus Woesearchaeota archaeon]
MARTDVEKYIAELRNAQEKSEADIYSLKEELNRLSESKAFENFERESATVEKTSLEQIKDFGMLLRARSLASAICGKKGITDKLHSMHFSLNMLKSGSAKEALDAFLYSKTKISNIIDELNDFKAKLEEIERCHSKMLPDGLDSRLHAEKYSARVETLRSMHKRQKNALISAVKLFIKMSKKHIKSQKSFK